MCDRHKFVFEFDRAYNHQLIEKFEASPEHPLSENFAPGKRRSFTGVSTEKQRFTIRASASRLEKGLLAWTASFESVGSSKRLIFRKGACDDPSIFRF